jgi:hypothetical protein
LDKYLTGSPQKTEKLQQPNEGPPKLSYLTNGKSKVESKPVFVNCFFAAAEASNRSHPSVSSVVKRDFIFNPKTPEKEAVMRRTNLLLASLTLFLLLALGCQQKPESIVSSNEAEQSLSKENAGEWFLTFKGRVEFSDGTVFESRTEKTIALPRRLWGREWTEQTESFEQNYQVEFINPGDFFGLAAGSSASFIRQNLNVHFCTAAWSHRSIATVSINNTSAGGAHQSILLDSKAFFSSPVNPIPPGATGTFYGLFSNEVTVAFDNDGDVDFNTARVENYDAVNPIFFTSIRYHLRSRNIACE